MWLSHLQFSLPFPPLPVSEYVTHVSIFLALINPIYLLSDKTPAYKNLSIQDFLSTFATSKFPAGACSPGWQWAASLLQPPPCCFINSKKKKKKSLWYSGFGSKQAFLVLLREHYLLLPLAGLFLQMLQYSSTSPSGSFSYPHFHPERKTYTVFIALNRKREHSKEDLQREGIWHYPSTLPKILQRNWLFWATACSLFCSHLWKLY